MAERNQYQPESWTADGKRILNARRVGRLSPAVPPAEVARLFGQASPAGAVDARVVVEAYCASAFGGVVAGEDTERDLRERLGRLRRLRQLAS